MNDHETVDLLIRADFVYPVDGRTEVIAVGIAVGREGLADKGDQLSVAPSCDQLIAANPFADRFQINADGEHTG